MKKILYILAFVMLAAGCQPVASDVNLQKDTTSVPLPEVINYSTPSQTDPFTPAFAAESGINGTTVIGPTCSDPLTSKNQSCVAQPYSATVQFQNAETNVMVAKVTSDKDGRFQVTLPPGTYLVIPVRTNAYPKADTQKVVVESNNYTDVTITFALGTR